MALDIRHHKYTKFNLFSYNILLKYPTDCVIVTKFVVKSILS